ncbi:MAG: MFS transporter [Mycobacterium sp.]
MSGAEAVDVDGPADFDHRPARPSIHRRLRSRRNRTGPAPETFAALSVRNYRIYAVGAVISNLGTWMQRVAQDWLVWQLTGSASAVGLATMAQLLPALVLSYPGGVIADRWNRRTTLLVSQAAMAAPSVLIGVLALTSLLPTAMLFALILWFGCATAIDAPLRHAFVADLVPNALLPNAVGLNSASFNAAQLVGPAIGGLLISAFGSGIDAAGGVVLLNSLSFVASVFALWRLNTGEFLRRRAENSSTDDQHRRRAKLPRPEIVSTLVLLFAVGTFGMAFRANNILMTTVTFHSGATTFGILGSLLALGSLCGAVLSARKTSITVRYLCGAALALGVASLAAAISPTLPWYALTLPALGFLSQTSTTPAFALLQMLVEEQRRGRIVAVAMTCLMGGTALSAPLLGILADKTSPRMCFLIGGAGAICGAVIAYGWYRRVASRGDPTVLPIAPAGQ